MKAWTLWCGVLLATSVTAAALADWPRYMGPADSGVAAAKEKITRSWPAEGPKVLWKVDVGSGYGGPAIANGQVCLLDRVSKTKDKFRVIDLAQGTEVWAFEYDTAPYKANFPGSRSSPTLDGDMAYTQGVMGEVYAFDLKAKKVAWQKNIQTDFGSKPGMWGYAASPLVVGENVIIDTAGSKDAGVVALNKKTGETVWRSPAFGDTDCYASPMLAKLDGVDQILVWHKGVLASLNPADGKILWKFAWNTDRPIPNPAILPDNKIFLTIGYGGGCSLLQVKKNGAAWDVKALFQGDNRSGSKISPAIAYDGHIYTTGFDLKKGLQCLDADGNVKWEGPKKFDQGTFLIADGVLFAVEGGSGVLHMIEASPAAYKDLASAPVLKGKECWAPMALSDGKLVLRDGSQMVCLEVGTVAVGR